MFRDLKKRLLNEWQRDFPLVPRPYMAIANDVGVLENDVLSVYESLKLENSISRIGAIVRPNVIGASTLAAMAVPPERLDDIAAHVSGYREVNHNYERDHRFNLWFVVTACNEVERDRVLSSIEQACDLSVMSLPLIESFHIDLGFDLEGSCNESAERTVQTVSPASLCSVDDGDRKLLWKLESGLPIQSRPFAMLGNKIDMAEEEVIIRLQRLIEHGVVRRFGVVVRHHEVGYNANAMVVWDVPDDHVSDVASRIVKNNAVTLCYQRPRHLPDWPYNLFTMIHGTCRDQVRAHIDTLRQVDGLSHVPLDVLFSERRFKQKGACYRPDAQTRTQPEAREVA